MNEVNRAVIALVAGVWIVLMAALIFLTWAAPEDILDRAGDFAEYLAAHNTDSGKLVVTCAALATAILALLVIVLEYAPEDEIKELRVEQAGATTIVPAAALRARLEEALAALPHVRSARTKVWTKDRGVAASVDLTVPARVNVASVTQDAVRVIVDAVQTDLGLPVAGVPVIRVDFEGGETPPAEVGDIPRSEEAPEPAPSPPSAAPGPQPESHADASPGPLIYDESPPSTHHPPRSLDAPDDQRT